MKHLALVICISFESLLSKILAGISKNISDIVENHTQFMPDLKNPLHRLFKILDPPGDFKSRFQN